MKKRTANLLQKIFLKARQEYFLNVETTRVVWFRLCRARWLRQRRGQAMVSYAIITASLLAFGTVFAMKILPDMLDAINSYTGSIYFSINMPFP